MGVGPSRASVQRRHRRGSVSTRTGTVRPGSALTAVQPTSRTGWSASAGSR